MKGVAIVVPTVSPLQAQGLLHNELMPGGIDSVVMKPLLAFLLASSALLAASPDAAIRAVLDDQVTAWNRGDVAVFMRGYADSADTIFIGEQITKGWQPVLERYRKAYPTPEKMGRLAFSDIEIRPLGDSHALVIGRYHLTRAPADGGNADGIFSLVFQRTSGGEWQIIADHTSSTKNP